MDNFKNVLPFESACRIAAPMSFNIMMKPNGSICNLDCDYCYYLDKADIYGGREPRMSISMLESAVREYIAANDVEDVTFNWHGGEPLLCGIGFYQKALEFQKRYASGKTIHNTIQTNGTLIDAGWARFFKENGFLVGISIDGPQDIHDRYRMDKGGRPSFTKVMNGIGMLKSFSVEFNTMTTINHASEGRGLEVYLFLKSLGSRHMQFMPVMEHVMFPLSADGTKDTSKRPYIVDPSVKDAEIASWSVNPVEYGRFMNQIFDYWVTNDVGEVFVNMFDATLSNACGMNPGTCVNARVCGGNAVIEHNGDIYPCDHFVYSDRILGNISETALKDAMNRPEMILFGANKRSGLPRECLRCEHLVACNGGCPKHRFCQSKSGEANLNALCAGYNLFFDHTVHYFIKMRELLVSGQSPAFVMQYARKRMAAKIQSK